MSKINLMNLTMSQVIIFITTAKFENFSLAAKFLNVTQPMVSRSIAQLENELGFALFVREKQRVRLTAAGKALAASWNSISYTFETSVMNARDISIQHKDVLSICDDRGTDKELYLYPVLDIFQKRFPDVLLNIEQADIGWAVESLRKNTTDVAFVMYHELSGLDPNTFEWEIVYKTNWYAFVPGNNPLYGYESIELKDLEDSPLILLSSIASKQYSAVVFGMFEKAGITPNIASRVSNNASLSFALHQGNGVVIANDLLAVPKVKKIKAFPIPGTVDGLALVWKKFADNPFLKDFTSITKEFFRSDFRSGHL